MLKPVIQIKRDILYVKLEDGVLQKLHSNLYTYTKDGAGIEFVANFSTPAVGGYVVLVPPEAPVYLTETEFKIAYAEQPDSTSIA